MKEVAFERGQVVRVVYRVYPERNGPQEGQLVEFLHWHKSDQGRSEAHGIACLNYPGWTGSSLYGPEEYGFSVVLEPVTAEEEAAWRLGGADAGE